MAGASKVSKGLRDQPELPELPEKMALQEWPDQRAPLDHPVLLDLLDLPDLSGLLGLLARLVRRANRESRETSRATREAALSWRPLS